MLADRAFITRPGPMVRGYLLAGLVAGALIALFGAVGVYGKVAGIEAGQDAPLRVSQAFGISMTGVMTVLMMVSAGSTLDSTFSAFSRAAVPAVRVAAGARRRVPSRLLAGDGNRSPARAGPDPRIVAVGDGPYAALLGANLVGTIVAFGGFALGALMDRRRENAAPPPAA